MATLLTLLDGAGTALVVAETGKTYDYPALRSLVLEFRDLLRTQLGVGTADVVASSFLKCALFLFLRLSCLFSSLFQ